MKIMHIKKKGVALLAIILIKTIMIKYVSDFIVSIYSPKKQNNESTSTIQRLMYYTTYDHRRYVYQ